MADLVVNPLPGCGHFVRLGTFSRRLFSRRLLLRLSGTPSVMLAGRVYAVRPVPLGVARELVPALVRCGKAFAAWDFSEALFDDVVKVLALGLGASSRHIEALPVSLYQIAPVVDLIAKTNGLLVLEAGSHDMGKLVEALIRTGTNSMPSSSAPPAGPGSMSTDA